MPRMITITSFRPWDTPNFRIPHTRQLWLGVNGKVFKTRKDCLHHGYR